MTIKNVQEIIDEKLKINENFVEFNFYFLNVKHNVKGIDLDFFLKTAKNFFQNNNYMIYKTGDKFLFNDNFYTVKENTYFIAIKNN